MIQNLPTTYIDTSLCLATIIHPLGLFSNLQTTFPEPLPLYPRCIVNTAARLVLLKPGLQSLSSVQTSAVVPHCPHPILIKAKAHLVCFARAVSLLQSLPPGNPWLAPLVLCSTFTFLKTSQTILVNIATSSRPIPSPFHPVFPS